MKDEAPHLINVIRPKHSMRFQEIFAAFGVASGPTSRQIGRRREFQAEFARVSQHNLPRSERRTIARDALKLKREKAKVAA